MLLMENLELDNLIEGINNSNPLDLSRNNDDKNQDKNTQINGTDLTQDSVKTYLLEIGKNPLLKSSDEKILAMDLEAAEKLSSLGDLEELTTEKINLWLNECKKNFIESKNSLQMLFDFNSQDIDAYKLTFREILDSPSLVEIINSPFSEDFSNHIEKNENLSLENITKDIKKVSIILRSLPPFLIDKIDEKKASNISEDDVLDIKKRFVNLKNKGQRAIRDLTESNLRLVVSVAKKHLNRGMGILDLVQEGNIGLLKAIKKFDYRRGFKFSTYATWWIRQGITRALADQSRTIRIPVHLVEALNKVTRVQRQLAQEYNREPTIEEIAKESGLTKTKIATVLSSSTQPISLATTIGDDSGTEIGHLVEDKSGIAPPDVVIKDMTKEEIAKLLQNLTSRERLVLQLRFGLSDGKHRTLEDIGNMLGLTRERIRQIEKKAINKLRGLEDIGHLRELIV